MIVFAVKNVDYVIKQYIVLLVVNILIGMNDINMNVKIRFKI